jgi:HK97 family phage major capsid protein
MTRNERELKAVEQEMVRISSEIQAIWTKADEEDRETSNEERGDVEQKLKAIDTLKAKKVDLEASLKVEADVKRVSGELGKTEVSITTSTGVEFSGNHWATPTRQKTAGEIFVSSEGFKAANEMYKSSGRLPQNFSTGSVAIDTKGTLLEGTGSPGSGTGGGLVPVPQFIPGVVTKLFQPLRIADLLLSGQATTNSVRYVVEGTATSGAAGVAEAAAKPESTVALSTVDEPIKKIATVLTLSDEMMEDAAQVESYINGRLQLFVNIEEERQIVLGAGTNELVGITGRSVNAYGRGTVDNNAVALFKAINGQRGSAFLEPDFVVMNPANWQTTRLMTDTAGQFQGGGPFMGQYGNGAVVPASGQISGVQDMIWNKPVIVTTAVGAGTAIIGTQAAAQLWYRGGLSVEATNSHQDYFTKNLIAIRAERRLGLAVYRPSAWTVVSGLN